ncbi:MAG: hypothetical protein WAM82_01620 [Thermoanaerobaculia bacterium]
MPLGGPSSRRFYIWCAVVCLVGLFLALGGELAIIYMEGRLGIQRPWFRDAQSGCQALWLFFALLAVVFRFFASSCSAEPPSE